MTGVNSVEKAEQLIEESYSLHERLCGLIFEPGMTLPERSRMLAVSTNAFHRHVRRLYLLTKLRMDLA